MGEYERILKLLNEMSNDIIDVWSGNAYYDSEGEVKKICLALQIERDNLRKALDNACSHATEDNNECPATYGNFKNNCDRCVVTSAKAKDCWVQYFKGE